MEGKILEKQNAEESWCCSCNLELERRQDAGIAVELWTCYANILPSLLSESSHGHLHAAPPPHAVLWRRDLPWMWVARMPPHSPPWPHLPCSESLHFSLAGLSGWSLNTSRMFLPLPLHLGLNKNIASSGKPALTTLFNSCHIPVIQLACILPYVFKTLITIWNTLVGWLSVFISLIRL